MRHYQYFLYLDAQERDLFEQSSPLFGAEVANKFPCLDYDVAEAGKCLAVGRSTAAVFHLMRVTEIGAQAVARCLGVPDPTKPAGRNLGMRLKSIKDQIDQKWTSGSRLAGDGKLFDEIYASLDARKNPWRNATHHPDRVYTMEEARDIFTATKNLLVEIAARCDENGAPAVP